jgi:hypothetical protein
MPIHPALRYVENDEILKLLIKDGVPLTVENYLGAVWRSGLPECRSDEIDKVLSEMAKYEAYQRTQS